MTEYVLTESARQDIDGIIDFLLKRESVERALHVYGKFEEAFTRIARAPGIGFQRHHIWAGKRVWPVFDWLVIYDPASTPVAIINIISGHQNLNSIFSAHAE